MGKFIAGFVGAFMIEAAYVVGIICGAALMYSNRKDEPKLQEVK